MATLTSGKPTYTCPVKTCHSTKSRKHPKWSWMRICCNCGHVADAHWFKHPEKAASVYSTTINKGDH